MLFGSSDEKSLNRKKASSSESKTYAYYFTTFFFSKHLSTGFIISFGFLEPVSRKSRKLFGPEKPFVELRPTYSVKLVFSYVVKGIKINITAMFRASRRLSFEDTKRIPSPEMRPISFGTFEKRAPGHSATRKFRSQNRNSIYLQQRSC